jgi:mannose-6-phosphate isomerase-like protein (cupin superfamily)
LRADDVRLGLLWGRLPVAQGSTADERNEGRFGKLKPGESVGWHSTSTNEEALVILRGSGVAKVEGHPDVPLTEKMLAYIPPATRHNVTNNGTIDLEYVWLVSPTNP